MPQLGYHLPRETTERCWVNCVKLGILHNSQENSQHTHTQQLTFTTWLWQLLQALAL